MIDTEKFGERAADGLGFMAQVKTWDSQKELRHMDTEKR